MTYASWDLLFGKINYYLGVLNLLPGSKKYQGKFNAEEAEIIERILKKYNLNANQFVRNSVMIAIELAEYQNMIATSPAIRKIVKTISDEAGKIMSNPRIVKRIERKMGARKITQESLDRLESKAEDIEKDVKKLRKKKKPGAPKIKKKRGKPKR